MKHLVIFSLSLIWSMAAGAQFKLEVNGQVLPAKLTFTIQDKKPVAVLATRLSVTAKSAIMYANGEEVEVKTKSKGGQTVFYLPSGNGELKVATRSGGEETFTITSNVSNRWFRTHKSCRIPGLKIRYQKKLKTSYFGGVYCKNKPKKKKITLYISTSLDSEWLGSNLFEKGGKGSRWKTFDLNLDGTKQTSNFRWGSKEQTSLIRAQIIDAPTPIEEEPPPYFYVGAEYLQQSSSSNAGEGSSSVLALRMNVLYPVSESIRVRADGGYLLQKLSGDEEDNPKFVQFKIAGDYVFGAGFFASLGYDLLSFSTPSPGLQIDFEAPYVGLGYRIQMSESYIDLRATYSQPLTDAEGASRTGAELVFKPFFFENTKAGLIYETIELTQPTNISSDRIGLQFYYGF